MVFGEPPALQSIKTLFHDSFLASTHVSSVPVSSSVVSLFNGPLRCTFWVMFVDSQPDFDEHVTLTTVGELVGSLDSLSASPGERVPRLFASYTLPGPPNSRILLYGLVLHLSSLQVSLMPFNFGPSTYLSAILILPQRCPTGTRQRDGAVCIIGDSWPKPGCSATLCSPPSTFLLKLVSTYGLILSNLYSPVYAPHRELCLPLPASIWRSLPSPLTQSTPPCGEDIPSRVMRQNIYSRGLHGYKPSHGPVWGPGSGFTATFTKGPGEARALHLSLQGGPRWAADHCFLFLAPMFLEQNGKLG